MKFVKHTEKDKSYSYATSEDFRRLFAEYADDLYLFSFLLTGDYATAERCFVAGLEDSMRSDSVFQDWARSWAKRAIIENAIRALQPRPPADDAYPAINGRLPETWDGPIELGTVLALDDFDRFVFVTSVLEEYSEKRSALLLDCTVPQIRNARARAIAQIAKSSRIGFLQAASA